MMMTIMMMIMMMLQTMVVLASMIQLIAVAFVIALLSTAFRNLVEVVVASKQKKPKECLPSKRIGASDLHLQEKLQASSDVLQACTLCQRSDCPQVADSSSRSYILVADFGCNHLRSASLHETGGPRFGLWGSWLAKTFSSLTAGPGRVRPVVEHAARTCRSDGSSRAGDLGAVRHIMTCKTSLQTGTQ